MNLVSSIIICFFFEQFSRTWRKKVWFNMFINWIYLVQPHKKIHKKKVFFLKDCFKTWTPWILKRKMSKNWNWATSLTLTFWIRGQNKKNPKNICTPQKVTRIIKLTMNFRKGSCTYFFRFLAYNINKFVILFILWSESKDKTIEKYLHRPNQNKIGIIENLVILGQCLKN